MVCSSGHAPGIEGDELEDMDVGGKRGVEDEPRHLPNQVYSESMA